MASPIRRLLADFPDLNVAVAPRDPTRFDAVADLLSREGFSPRRRSRIDEGTGEIRSRVLLLDSIGELFSLYRFMTLVFVGGSLSRDGGHNVLEPAFFSRPALFGPSMENFEEEGALLCQCNGGLRVADAAGWEAALRRWLDQPGEAEAAGRRAREAVLGRSGAADLIVRGISEAISGA